MTTHADAARESARRTNGQFGTRPAAESTDVDLSAPIKVSLEIENYYGGGEMYRTYVETEIDPPPSLDRDDWQDWEDDEIFPHTGTGQSEGDSAYFVTVTASSRPEILTVGTQFEFGT